MTKRIKNTFKRSWALPAAFVAIASASCYEGGLNQNEQKAGDGDQGADLTYGSIAVDPTGKYLLSASYGRLIHAEIEGGKPRVLEGLKRPERVAFGHDDHSLFVSLSRSNDLPCPGTIKRYDLTTNQESWSLPITVEWGPSLERLPWLEVTEDDHFLIVANAESVDVVDTETGTVKYSTGVLERPIVDVDLTPDQKTLIVTLMHEWRGGVPSTIIKTWDLETFASVSFDVPNCSSELVIDRDGKSAYLAPTSCQKDPVSVVDLMEKKWVRNLPGFGPVALSPKGDLAIAFMNAANLDASLFQEGDPIPSKEVQFHLMLIDTKTLKFDILKLGGQLPRYAVSPDGTMVLIDNGDWFTDGRIRILDVATKRLVAVKGPAVELDNYVVKSDSSALFLLDAGLYRLSLKSFRADAEPIDFTPSAINITPDDKRLLLRASESVVKVYGVDNGAVERAIDLGGLVTRIEVEGSVDVEIR